MQTAPFLPLGNSVILTTNAVAATSTPTPVVCPGATGLNLLNQPIQARFLNLGASMIWLNISTPANGVAAAGVAAAPTPGTTTLGTPQAVFWLAPGIEVSLTLPAGIAQLVGVAGNPLGFWLNHVSPGVSQSFQMQLGDGT